MNAILAVMGVAVFAGSSQVIGERPLVGPEAIMTAAQSEEASKDWPGALRRYQQLIKEYPGGEYQARAWRAIARIQSDELKEPKAALDADLRVLDATPSSDPMVTYQAANDIIALAGKVGQPELKCRAYEVLLNTMKGSWNRSSWLGALAECEARRGNLSAARTAVDRMFTECASEQHLKANAEALLAALQRDPKCAELSQITSSHIAALPAPSDPDASSVARYRKLIEEKDYAGAIDVAQALATSSPQGPHTAQILMDAQGVAESQLKDWRINQKLCRLAALSLKGNDEGDLLRVALIYWMRASVYLKDQKGADEAASYAVSHCPDSAATDDVLLQAVKLRAQKGPFWVNVDEMSAALKQIRSLRRRYPNGSAEMEARWLEERLQKMIVLERQASK